MGERSLVDNEGSNQSNEQAISDWYNAIKKLHKKDILARILDGYDKLPRNTDDLKIALEAGIDILSTDTLARVLFDVEIDFLVLGIVKQTEKLTKRRVNEGVANERSDPMSGKSKLDSAELAPIFEGELNREAMAKALSAAMSDRGLSSIRKAAEAANVDKKDIQRISGGEASLDKSKQILSELGYEMHFEMRRIDKS